MSDTKVIYREIESPLGNMLIGVTSKGLCLLEFEDRGGLERIKKRILKRYRMEMEIGEHKLIDQTEKQLQEYYQGKRKDFTIQLDMKGTVFQKTVWEQLLTIPYGETRGYGELAAQIGNKGASRAVGSANGNNYISIIVPCHRVIEAGGGLRGYGGGLHRKKYLLDLEKGQLSVDL